MFVNELRMRVTAQENAEIIEPRNDPLQLHTVHEENGHRHFRLAHVVQKSVLEVLVFVRRHLIAPVLYVYWFLAPEHSTPQLHYQYVVHCPSQVQLPRQKTFEKDRSSIKENDITGSGETFEKLQKSRASGKYDIGRMHFELDRVDFRFGLHQNGPATCRMGNFHIHA